MVALNEKKLRSHQKTLQRGRKEGTSGGPRQEDNEDENKLFPRGRGTGGEGTFLGEGNWLLAGKDACSDYGRCRLCSRRRQPPTLGARRAISSINVLYFSELLVKKLTTYGTALSLYPFLPAVTFPLPPSSPSHLRTLPTKSCHICLPNLTESIPRREQKSFPCTRAGLNGENACVDG